MNEKLEKFMEEKERIIVLLDNLKGDEPCPNCLKLVKIFIEIIKFTDKLVNEVCDK